MLNRFGDFFLGSIAKVASLATFVLNEIAPYKKDFEVVSATTQNIGLLGPLAAFVGGFIAVAALSSPPFRA